MSDQPETPKLSDEQITALAAAFSITESDEAKRRELVEAKVKEYATETDPPPSSPPAPTPSAPPAPSGERSATELAELEVLKAKADRGDQAFAQMRTDRIAAKLTKATEDGRLDPAKRETWEQAFEENETLAEKMLADLPVNEEFKRVYGVDADGLSPEDQTSAEDRAYETLVGMTPGPAPSLQKASA